MQKLCENLAYITLIFGIIGSVVAAILFGRDINFLTGESEFAFLKFLIILAGGVFAVLTQFAILNGIATILKKLETVKQEDPAIDTSNTWECPKCGKRNYNYVTTCDCGTSR